MGYRSDVAMCMYAHQKEDFPVLKVWFDQFEHDIKKYWDGYFEIRDGSLPFILFEANDVKWYDSYDAVRFINDMLSDFRDAFQTGSIEQYYNYELIRIGEETNDIEEECGYGGFDILGVNRSIDIR